VVRLFADASIRLSVSSRGYRPTLSLPGFDTKILKPRAIVEMLQAGARDVGFAGKDWVNEHGADLVELLDTELNPVRLVAAAPDGILENGKLPAAVGGKPLVVASEYVKLAEDWISANGLNATLLPSYGATEVLPPDDADCIIDNTATGATLEANGLTIIDDLMRSSTRLYASPKAMDDPARRDRIEHLALLLRSVLEARKRVTIELNVGPEMLDKVVDVLPCMREPTVSQLHHGAGYAVKAAVPKAELTRIISDVRERGGTDIIVSTIEQIIP
ncbi:MAG: ATP phosphoribosyltransferase, partial [Planctomycetota bacterium]